MNTSSFGGQLSQETLAPILEKQVMLVIGGGKGDEGKGGDAFALASYGDYELVISSVGGPNAGHTVITNDKKTFVGHNLPGAVVSGKDVFLGQAKFINISGLQKEIENLKEIGVTSKVYIADGAHVLFSSFHGYIDAYIEEQKQVKIGTTKSGVGPGVATRALRSGITIGQLASAGLGEGKKLLQLLTLAWDISSHSYKQIEREFYQEKYILQQLISENKIQIVNDMFAQEYYLSGKKLLIEGSQSPELGMFGGSYPYNTSTDTSFLGNLSPLGINPTQAQVGQLLVAKLFPSAVGSHVFPERISNIFPDLKKKEAEFGRKTGEYGATTKRARMIAFPSPQILAKKIQESSGYTTALSLRKLDVLEAFRQIIELPQVPVVIGYDSDKNPILDYLSYDVQKIVTLYKEIINKDILYIGGFGPEPENSRII